MTQNSKEETPDYYKILGLNSNATSSEIKKAFKTLSQRHHPDKNPDDLDRYRTIRKAYEVLYDSYRRAAYDHGLRQGFNPDEFRQVLSASIEKVVMQTLGALDAQASSGRVVRSFKSQARIEIVSIRSITKSEMHEFERRYKFAQRQLNSIVSGHESHIYKILTKKVQALSSLIRTHKMHMAVLKFILEDVDVLVCEQPTEEHEVFTLPKNFTTGTSNL